MTISAILSLADDLHYYRLADADLPEATRNLSSLNDQTLQALIQQADAASLIEPRRGWAIMAVTDAAASHDAPTFLQGLAAWHLARLANEYTHPRLVQAALSRARPLFEQCHEPVWLAACTWQEHALAFANANLLESITKLEAALITLEEAGADFAAWVPLCRLSLAANQMMVSALSTAEAQIRACEEVFVANNDQFSLGRCLLSRINLGRRMGLEQEVKAWIAEAITLVAAWPAEKAKINLQKGYVQWLNQGDFNGAITTLLNVIQQFTLLDMPVWAAQAQDALAQVYTITGMGEAGELLQEALNQATYHGASQLQAAIQLDRGWYYTQRGDPGQALNCLEIAEQLTRQSGNHMLYAAALMHLSDGYVQAGRYQLALRRLEQSAHIFQQFDNLSRMVECNTRLAHIWLQLGQANRAHQHLDLASNYASRINYPGIWPYIFYHRAHTYLHQGETTDARSALEEGLQVAQQYGDPYSIALAQYILGDMLAALHQPMEAFSYLRMAQDSFKAMNMTLDEANCSVALGHCFLQMGHNTQAQEAWEQAMSWSLDTMPDITWQAAAGLATLAETRGDRYTALRHYHQVREALRQLREGFWQPELVNSFLQRPTPTLDRAVQLAVQIGTSQDVLAFIEENKARLIARYIQSNPLPQVQPPSPELQTLLGEIRWRQGQLRAMPGRKTRFASREEQALKQDLKDMVRTYELKRSQWQRQNQDDPFVQTDITFDLETFQKKTQAHLGNDWVALDFYLTEEQLQGVVITPTTSFTWAKKYTMRAERALLDMIRFGGKEDESELADSLAILGKFLIPEEVAQQLSPHTTLIIASHRELHQVPWAALRLNGMPLVMACVPAIVPSLSSLLSLWSRPRRHPSPLSAGLLVAISNFPDDRTPLPEVVAECEWVRPHLGPSGEALCEDKATWNNFLALGRQQGLDRFSFIHVASHTFHEALTGLLSGISFYDRDVELDELWQCAPLPQLIILSACSSSKSKVHEGDEHIGLATTCLIAGAHTIVGSLWPVPDKDMPLLMRDFYASLAEGKSVAQALALAQRRAWEQNKSWRLWGALTCTGTPV